MKANGKYYIIHEKEIMLDRDKLKNILDSKGIDYTQFHDEVTNGYGLDMTYKGFMNLLSNRSTWKLIYAWAIAEYLQVEIKDIFNMVEIDVSKAVSKRKKWEEKYQNPKLQNQR